MSCTMSTKFKRTVVDEGPEMTEFVDKPGAWQFYHCVTLMSALLDPDSPRPVRAIAAAVERELRCRRQSHHRRGLPQQLKRRRRGDRRSAEAFRHLASDGLSLTGYQIA